MNVTVLVDCENDSVKTALEVAGALGVGLRGVCLDTSAGLVDEGLRRALEALHAPVDAYGVGSSLVRGSNDFTADVTTVDGRPCAKTGRGEKGNPRLQRVM